MEWTTQSSDELLRREWEELLSVLAIGLLCIFVRFDCVTAGNTTVQYALRNLSGGHSFLFFCEMTFTFDTSRGVFSQDVWSNEAFLCDSARGCVDFVAAGFFMHPRLSSLTGQTRCRHVRTGCSSSFQKQTTWLMIIRVQSCSSFHSHAFASANW